MNRTINNCAIIILAAGASTRLGRPKQLLPFNGKSLLENAVDTANEAEANPVIVVLGANAALLEKEIDEKKVHIVENKEWEEGMASSIRCGLETLQHIAPSADGVILMVCDQPHVSASLLNEILATQKKTARLIVTSQYKDAVGPPALFHRSVFSELLALKGDAGARKIVEKYHDNLATVSFEKGGVDIDTEDDYKTLNQ